MEEITFRSGNETLCGTLFLPASFKEPVAAMAFLVGSGGESERFGDAWGFKMWVTLAEHCSQNGLAVLLFDKPGNGGSTGSWEKQDFHARAKDALSAVHFLQSRSEIDSNRIGLIGHSQGGWIAQLAAANYEEVKFIITLAGPYISVYEQIMTDIDLNHRAENKSAVQRKLALMKIKTLLKLAKLFSRFGYNHYINLIIDYDPVPFLPKIKCPVLALFGEKDVLCPPGSSLQNIKRSLSSKDVTYMVFPETNHLFWKCKTGSTKEFSQLEKKFVPAFLPAITDWLTSRV